jgi:hypothetical protein
MTICLTRNGHQVFPKVSEIRRYGVHSTVTLLARLRGWSISQLRILAM